MKVKDVSHLINRHEGESALLVGSAPTLELAEAHSLQVGLFVGDSMLRTSIYPPVRYFIRANSLYPNLTRKSHLSDLKRLDATWVIAETVIESSTPVRQLLEGLPPSDRESFVFDQRHFGGSPCPVPGDCCRVLNNKPSSSLTLQEILADYSKSESVYSSGSTVSLHALALAVIMGCKEIHVAGVEIPRISGDYVYARSRQKLSSRFFRVADETFFLTRKALSGKSLVEMVSFIASRLFTSIRNQARSQDPSIFAPDFDQIIQDFDTIVRLASAKNAKIFVCSPTSSLLQIDGVSQCPLIPQ